MKEDVKNASKKNYPPLPVIERKIVPAIREGIDLVMMILFTRLREKFVETYPEMDKASHSMLAGAVINRIFGGSNPDGRFETFNRENEELIESIVSSFSVDFNELLIIVTDALRMQFLCDEREGLGREDENRAVLKKAADLGILIQERDAPMPKEFMNLVHRIGRAQGLVR